MKKKYRMKSEDRGFYIINALVASLFLIVTLYPLVYIISASFSSGVALAQGRVWLWPVDFTLDGYQAVFSFPAITRGYWNAIVYTVIGTVFNVALTTLAAYPLSRKDLYGQKIFMGLFIFTMMFSGGLIPSYLLIKDLKMINTIWALVLPGAISVWNMSIMMNFFRGNLPDEILESAQIDGSGDFRFMVYFAIPLSKAIIAIMALFYAVSHWNSYFSAMIYLNSPEKFPLQLVLRDLLIQNKIGNQSSSMDMTELMRKQNIQDLLKYAVIVVSCVPMMILYPLVQKHLIKGVMIGSVKG